MAMNAAAQSLMGLITNAALRFVVPVYQRPYSWDEEQCEQLWEDILFVGKRPNDRHFTGSVVWIQDGVMSANGITPRLLIDGQQRITTVTLLLIALADYAKNHKDEDLSFSYTRIINKGYLIDDELQGEDRYRLLLSQGDRATLSSLVENLYNPDTKVVEESNRLIENLNFFKARLESIEDVNVVWDGVQRLDVVSISLDAGQDNPQLIFESMNSTGKDLSSADLIRNYVLMGLPRNEQDSLYLNHWRVIEETLGKESYDKIFDSFIRNYLTVLYAPEPLAKRDVYPIFKKHVIENNYDKDGHIVDLLIELEHFARYYSAITAGMEKDLQLKAEFDNLAKLELSVLNPLLMSFYQDFEDGAFEHEDFVSMLKTLESYVFRRAVCDVASNSLNKFFPSIIAKLNKVQDDEGNYREAFESLLKLEAGTARRFPTDEEFAQALITRDAYHFRKSFYLLSSLENSFHPKNPIDFGTGSYSIEHILPQNALARDDWKSMLGPEPEEGFEVLVNNLGNLTLTAYNSELSDESFENKKTRYIGGYGKDHIALSGSVRNASQWGEDEIAVRAKSLAQTAKHRWPFIEVSDETAQKYTVKKDPLPKGISKAAFKYIFNDGLIKPGDKLVSTSRRFIATATVTEKGTLVLTNGEEFQSPSLAAIRVVSLAGGAGSRNGWKFWRVGENGPLIDELRTQYLGKFKSGNIEDTKAFRITFWDGLYEYCVEREGFIEAFADPSNRTENPDSWASFGIGRSDSNTCALLFSAEKEIGAQMYCSTVDCYQKIYDHKDEVNQKLSSIGGKILWDAIDADKKTRIITIRKPVDFANDEAAKMYEWIVNCLFVFRNAAIEYL